MGKGARVSKALSTSSSSMDTCIDLQSIPLAFLCVAGGKLVVLLPSLSAGSGCGAVGVIGVTGDSGGG